MAAGKPFVKGSREEAEERLLVQAAQKDPSRFADLYEANFERVYAFIARRVQNRDVAEDLTSEAFQKALASLPKFDWRGIPFAVWLLRIASNLVTDRWKASGREIAMDDPPEPVLEVCPEDVEYGARVFRMVDQLPPDQKHVIYMRFAEGKSIREMAQELGRTEGAIKQLQFRGLENLRSLLGGKHA